MTPEHRPPLTDSPWFWVLLFAGMALAALLAIGPKYAGRQARLERQYQARERIVADLPSGNISADDERSSDQAERREFASSDNTLIPLWPLAVILSLVMLLAAIMLARGRRRGPSSPAATGSS